MISFLRFLGVLNAAIWFGAVIFVTFFAGPAFFSGEMLEVFKGQRYFAGAAAQVILGRYFILHYICGSLALAHLLAERLYLNRRLTRFTVGLWAMLVAVTLLGGVWLQPKLHELHQAMYFGGTPAVQAEAKKTFGGWHGISQAGNLFTAVGLLVYFWRMTHPRRTRDSSEI